MNDGIDTTASKLAMTTIRQAASGVSPACTPALRHSAWGKVRRALGRTMLRWGGWTVVGGLPNVPKFMLVCAPHTSNWDFFVMLQIAFAMDFEVSWVGKDSLFRPPFGAVARWLGGIPVVRGAKAGQSAQVAAFIQQSQRVIVAIAPEGTRSKAGRWRSGFWHMASQAGVPIQLASLDYAKRIGTFGPCMTTSGDLQADFARMVGFFQGVSGKYPDQQGEIALAPASRADEAG